MINRFKFSLFAVIVVVVATCVCSCTSNKFKIGGRIADAQKETVTLEKPGFNGEWIAVDSTVTNSEGEFEIRGVAPEYPEIYRIGLNGNYIYVPVDSAVNINVSTSKSEFANQFTMSGTESAKKMEKFETMLAKALTLPTDSMPGFKRKLFTEVIYPGKGDIMSYYILTRMVAGKPLFDPRDATDAKYYAAVATAYKHYRSDDPRTSMLENLALSAHKNQIKASGKQNVVEAPTVSIIDMEFPNVEGERIKLSDVVGKGKPTLVIFSMVAQKESPEVNRAIAEIYKNYSNSYNFYEVCLDPDISEWREAVKNIPWTAVIDYEGLQSRIALQYNVSTLPSFFIYNKGGELVARADDFAALKKELQKY